MTKNKLILIGLLFLNLAAIAQVKIGDNSGTLHPSAVLELESTTKAVLMPRMTTAMRDAISSPVIGLTIFNTNTNCLNWWTGTQWYVNCDGSTPELGTNTPPVVNAGVDVTISPPANTTSLVATATDADGSIATRLWTQVSGPSTATIVSPTALSTTINDLTLSGVYVFRFTATDNDDEASSDTVSVFVMLPQPPVANAGEDQTVLLPGNAVLNAAASYDPDGTITTWTWTLLSGPNTPTITGASTSTATISGLVAGTYVYQIKVIDSNNLENTDTVSITVTNSNIAPVSRAGNSIRLLLGQQITLNGSGSYDADGTVVGYAWAQTGGNLSLTIADPNAVTTTVADASNAGWATFSLTVTDNIGATHTSSVTLYIQTGGSFGKLHGEASVPFSDNTYCDKQVLTVSGCNNQFSVTTPGGQTISLVEVNGQCWFGENMTDIPSNYNPAPAFVANTENGHSRMDNYGNGRWYQLSAALNGAAFGDNVQGICPAGFHIPSDCDWMYLEHGLGASVASQLTTSGNRMNAVGLKLHSPSGSSGMNLTAGGGLSNTGSILLEGRFGQYMSIGYSPNYNTVRTITYVANSGNGAFTRGFSSPMGEASYVRCVKD